MEIPSYDIRIEHDNKITRASAVRDGCVLAEGTARCHPADEFNPIIGAKLALERLDENLGAKIMPELKSGYVIRYHEWNPYTDESTEGYCFVIESSTELCLSGPEQWMPVSCLNWDGTYYGEEFVITHVYGRSRYNRYACRLEESLDYRPLLWTRP